MESRRRESSRKGGGDTVTSLRSSVPVIAALHSCECVCVCTVVLFSKSKHTAHPAPSPCLQQVLGRFMSRPRGEIGKMWENIFYTPRMPNGNRARLGTEPGWL